MGSGNAPGTGGLAWANDGPMARTSTLTSASPPTMMPPIMTLSPARGNDVSQLGISRLIKVVGFHKAHPSAEVFTRNNRRISSVRAE